VVGNLDVKPGGSTDHVPFLKDMKAAGAQALYFGGTSADQGCGIRAAMNGIFSAGEAAPLIGGDGIAEDPACVEAAGASSPGIVATVPAPYAEAAPAAAPVIAAFKAAYPKTSDYGPYTIPAYDAAGVLFAALDRAIRADYGHLPPRGNVISQLSVPSAFTGATGAFAFDASGDTTRRVISVFEATSPDPQVPWKLAQLVDYSAALPY
jgi:ABC-type branched-subunit amino acid transport system substrate-binding protein